MSIPVAKEYIKNFEKLGLGMFIHWGLYSQLEKGEWIYYLDKMNMNEYSRLKETFTAEDFDAEEIVLTAKNAGCKYITLTTRHHEGFSLYDTCSINSFDAPHSPAKRDLVREFTDACNKHGILPFFYHTTIDWYYPDFKNNFNEYLEYLRKSVEVLCRNYGKIGGFWFDGNWDLPDADWKLSELYGTIRKYQPDAMIINNTGMNARGEISHIEVDSVTFEQGRPTPMNREGMEKYISAEMCCTMNDNWGYAKNDFNYKSPNEIIRLLCECRKVGANFLLNIGPEPQGKIPGMQKEILNIIGKWMENFSEAIYEGKPYSARSVGKNFILKGENSLYIFAFDLVRKGYEHMPEPGQYSGAYAFSNVVHKIEKIFWMDNNEELIFTQNENSLSVNLTSTPHGANFCVRVAKAIFVKTEK